MAGINFTQYVDSKTLARDSQAILCPQSSIFISADMKRDRIDLAMVSDTHNSAMTFTAAQARSIAAELLACADARDAFRPAEPGLEG